MLRVTINGKEHHFLQSVRLIDGLTARGYVIPSLCHDERLAPSGACRICIVAIAGRAQPITACNNMLEDGMIIETDSEKILSLRRTLLELLARDYPNEAIMREPQHDFHRLLSEYSVTSQDHCIAAPIDTSHPYIRVDMSRCIYCYRCVRICDDVQGQFVWKTWHRGDRTRIISDGGERFADSTCTSCGACADTCPSGAIMDKSLDAYGIPAQWTKTVCAYCGVGCEMQVGTQNGVITNIRPAKDAPVNRGHLCSKGRYAFDYVHSSDRLQKPLLREDGQWKEASWDLALDYICERFITIKMQHSPDAIGVLGSARATNEENYLIQKFARIVLETNNVDCCARVCHTPSAAALKLMLGSGASTNSFADIECAKTLMLCGTNTTENHPIVGARVNAAVLNGSHLIVIDPRNIELAQYATVHLALRPGTNILLFNALAHVIVEEGLTDAAFINERVDGLDDFKSFIRDFSPDKIGTICGLNPSDIRKAARLYAQAKPSMILNGLGVTEFAQGTKTVMALINLALLTGNLGKAGSGVNPMRGQNNVQGAAIMGCDPNSLAGGISIKDGKAHCEKVWQKELPKTQGLNLLRMMDAAGEKKLKALYVIGYDVLMSNPNINQSRRSFGNLDFVVIQDIFMTKTASEFGHVVLPVCSSFEKIGTFMNAERRIQLVRKVIDPLPGTKTDSEVIKLLAKKMGRGQFFSFESAQEIWDEVRKAWPDAEGITYDRIDKQGGIQWPCPHVEHPGTAILHVDTFKVGKKAQLRKVNFIFSPEQTDPNYPFLLMTGRKLYQFNVATMSGRTLNSKMRPSDTLDINPIDAASLNLSECDILRIISRYGEAMLPVRICEETKPGELFCTFSTPDFLVNNLTGPHRDSVVDTPEYKITAVRLEKVIV